MPVVPGRSNRVQNANGRERRTTFITVTEHPQRRSAGRHQDRLRVKPGSAVEVEYKALDPCTIGKLRRAIPVPGQVAVILVDSSGHGVAGEYDVEARPSARQLGCQGDDPTGLARTEEAKPRGIDVRVSGERVETGRGISGESSQRDVRRCARALEILAGGRAGPTLVIGEPANPSRTSLRVSPIRCS